MGPHRKVAKIYQALDAPICPICMQPAERTDTRYGVRHDCCGLHSWGGKPLVDADTHAARIAAHAAFDELWKSKTISRSKAYKMLAQEMGISKTDCHISLMTRELAEQVPRAVSMIHLKIIGGQTDD